MKRGNAARGSMYNIFGDKPHTAAKRRKHVSCPLFFFFDSMPLR